MKKLYYLKYGSELSKEAIRDMLDSKWDIFCTENDSYYFGVYFTYTGLHVDKLTITDNYISSLDEWLDEDNKQYTTLIKMSFVNGKNTDKLSRYKFMKNVITRLDIASILDDKCIEENL